MEERTLKKGSIGLAAGVATAMGVVVGSTTLVSLGQGFGLGGKMFVIAMLIAAAISFCTVLSFGELSSLIPRAGGINHFTLPAMGPFMAILAVFCGYVLITFFGGAAEAALPGLIIHDFFPWINPKAFSIFMECLFCFINIRGVELFGRTQVVLTVIMATALAGIGFIGVTGIGATGVPLAVASEPLVPMSGMGLLSLVSLAFWLFIGLEYAVPLAEEMRKPQIYIPLSMTLGLVLILVAKVLFGLAAIKYVPGEVLVTSVNPHIDVATAILGRPGQILMAVISVTAAWATSNAAYCAIPRIIYGMAQEGMAPKIFGKLSRWNTPWVATVFVVLLSIIPILIGISDVDTIIIYVLASCVCWTICYIIAHLNVIILRRKYPHEKRPFRSPLWIIPQLLGIGAFIYMIYDIWPDLEIKKSIYICAFVFIVVSAILSALWVKFKMKKGLFETTPLHVLNEQLERAEKV